METSIGKLQAGINRRDKQINKFSFRGFRETVLHSIVKLYIEIFLSLNSICFHRIISTLNHGEGEESHVHVAL